MKLNVLKNSDVQAAIFIILFICGVAAIIITELRLDKDLTDSERIKQIESQFESEFENIKLPPKTAVNKSDNRTKRAVAISLTTRYRTELNQTEFESNFKKELERNDWIYYGYNSEHPFVHSQIYCKGKSDASLSLEPRSIWNDNADYYQLNLSLGQRDLINTNAELPDICK